MIIITGQTQSGKSTLAMKLFLFLKAENIKVSGIIARGLWKDNLRSGFDLINLSKDEAPIPLARRNRTTGNEELTPFNFFDSGLKYGENALNYNICKSSEIIIVDEVGKLELQHKGWSPFLPPLLKIQSTAHIWIVRENLVDDVCKNWNIKNAEIINVNDNNALNKLKTLCENLLN